MLKDIIEKNNKRIDYFIDEMNTYEKTQIEKIVFNSIIEEHKKFIIDLKKEAELQEEIIKALIDNIPKDNCYKRPVICQTWYNDKNNICYKCPIVRNILLVEKY